MTLKEKFLPFVDYIDLINDIPDKEECGLRNASKCIEIADEFAIGFGEWLISRAAGEEGLKLRDDILEIYKKEKRL
jgi:hypothetical protein